ncbi:sialate O-acetylesterase [Jiulongibacter sediminis]|uniref:Sialate O-acetylesterase domain-containing protein n=1 Tax=Jiulongibacter sediminis TaxID=1605367 RepID=A0A0N8HA58_9BACT|nr:sialate O-acetylesterase [Jiulongibacter sediminis]KPM49252.1 hypothetical protein AFM12_01070 [Jiulongibacter sediminis]TBX26307.1 hypothetical protein TK44_01070 [Jiulongibacter sediminis]
MPETNLIARYFPFFLFLISASSFSQVNLTHFPEDMQLFTRNDSDTAFVSVSGELQSDEYSQAVVKLYEEKKLFSTYPKTISQEQNFDFSIPIRAQMKEYAFELWLYNGADSVLIKRAEKVICGDAFILYGQSNAVSYAQYWVLNDSISKKFTRNYIHYFSETHENDGWHDGTYPEIGTLGKRFCLDYTRKLKIPILIINGAVGGVSLSYLMHREESDPESLNTTYGLLLKRTLKSSVDRIRGFIFFQGESEANASAEAVKEYPLLFDLFKQNVEKDFPSIDRFYVFQVGIMNSHALWEAAELREYKRSLSTLYNNISVIPATGIVWWDYDGLHYSFKGYNILAERLFDSFLAFEKGKEKDHTPDLKKLVDEKVKHRLKLIFNQEVYVPDSVDFGYYVNYMKHHFYAGRDWGFIDSLETVGNSIYLYYNRLPSNQLTYLPGFYVDPMGRPYGGPFIRNLTGTPALTFYNVAIEDQLPNPVIDSSYYLSGLIHFDINNTPVLDCHNCTLEVSQLTSNGQIPLASFNSNTTSVDFREADYNSLNETSTLVFKYVNQVSESDQVIIGIGGKSVKDTDFDAIPDGVDNCPLTSNPGQTDFDKDGLGDACDDDDDDDGIADADDNCLLRKNPEQPELLIEDGYLVTSNIPGKQYHWVVNGAYSETTNDNLYIVRNTGEYAVYITDELGCESKTSEPLQVSILAIERDFEIEVYPVPFSDRLNFKTDMAVSKAELIGMSGKIMKSFNLQNGQSYISTKSLLAGSYIFRLIDAKGKPVLSQKVTKSE